jgi:Na+/H+ antiporter NhaD/arsenite permease-like protein
VGLDLLQPARLRVVAVGAAAHQQRAVASTLAGNFSVVGSVANLIVVQRADSAGVVIGFWAYFAVGAPLTVLSILVGLAWL